MNSTSTTFRSALLFTAALGLAAACGGEETDPVPPGDGTAVLTIVGDSNMFLDHGVERTLSVRYHDSNDNALTGQVGFAISGDSAGTALAEGSAATNSQGIAEITISAVNADAIFEVSATAELAASVTWQITVGSPFDLDGNYDIDSNFDMATNMPGTIGDVVNIVIDLTNGVNDPASFLLDLAEEEISLIGSFRPGLDVLVNDLIKENSPDLINDLVALGNDFGEVARKFGTDSMISVRPDGAGEGLLGSHTMTGFHFRINNQTYGFTNAELGEEDVVVQDIGVSFESGRMVLGRHDLPVQYGGFLAMALEDVIVPLIDSNAGNLEELLGNRIDCAAVGVAIADFIGFLSASVYEGACEAGLSAAASIVMEELIDLDDRAQVVLQLTGNARVNDTNADRKVDSLTQGKWAGLIDYLGETGNLTDDGNTFSGTRMAGQN